jgi:HEAT repeat protein
MLLRTLASAVLIASLAGCGGGAPYEGKSVAELETMLADPSPAVQAQGAHGLALKGADARSAVPALIGILQKGEPIAQEQAALALGKIGPDAKEAIPALTEALKNSAWTVQRQAALALAAQGTQAKSAVPALEKLRDSPNRPVREAVAEALKKVR